MKAAISILEHELAYAKGNRGRCPHNDDYFSGWCESLKAAIYVLQMAANVSQPSVEVDAESRAVCHLCGLAGGDRIE